MDIQGEFTARLNLARDHGALELLPVVYDELHRLARRAMAGQPPGPTLQTTALLHEAWLRLDKLKEADWESRDHFLAVAARAMRSVLVDHARRRRAAKREGERLREDLDLDLVVDRLEENASDLVALDAALEELGEVDKELMQIVELRFFGGLKHPAIARALGISLRAVERGWSTARAWLHRHLTKDGHSAPG